MYPRYRSQNSMQTPDMAGTCPGIAFGSTGIPRSQIWNRAAREGSIAPLGRKSLILIIGLLEFPPRRRFYISLTKESSSRNIASLDFSFLRRTQKSNDNSG